MTDFVAGTHIGRTRTRHQCGYCMTAIPKGSPAIRMAGVFQGDFFSLYGHVDCDQLWHAAYSDYWQDFPDGMPFDLCEALGGDEGREYLLAELDTYRGRFPHSVTRIERRLQMSDLRYLERCRERGWEPDPDDCPPVYG